MRRLDPTYYLEEGETWYRAIDGYARTPGHRAAGGVRDRVFDPSATILRCFGCHSTGRLRVVEDRGIVHWNLQNADGRPVTAPRRRTSAIRIAYARGIPRD